VAVGVYRTAQLDLFDKIRQYLAFLFRHASIVARLRSGGSAAFGILS
jgi:hypothetical protein